MEIIFSTSVGTLINVGLNNVSFDTLAVRAMLCCVTDTI